MQACTNLLGSSVQHENLVRQLAPELSYSEFNQITSPLIGLEMTRAEALEQPIRTLQRWRYRDSTDPIDKLYGLMGLFRRSDLPSITCDYTASASKVFTDLTLDLLRLAGNLLPLVGWRGEMHVTPGLPTWALDMVRPHNEAKTGWCGYWEHAPRFQLFQADNNMTLEFTTSVNQSVLMLQGLLIDVVEAIDEGFSVGNDDRVQIPVDGVVRMLRKRKQLFSNFMHQKSSQTYIAGNHWYNAFCKAMLGDSVEREDVNERSRQDDTELLDAFLEDGNKNRVYPSVLSMIQNQTFFITQKGYIGIGPWNTREGDTAWILRGGRLPFILRPLEGVGSSSSDYIFIGDTHVEGVMFGELLRSCSEELRYVSIH